MSSPPDISQTLYLTSCEWSMIADASAGKSMSYCSNMYSNNSCSAGCYKLLCCYDNTPWYMSVTYHSLVSTLLTRLGLLALGSVIYIWVISGLVYMDLRKGANLCYFWVFKCAYLQNYNSCWLQIWCDHLQVCYYAYLRFWCSPIHFLRWVWQAMTLAPCQYNLDSIWYSHWKHLYPHCADKIMDQPCHIQSQKA